jgi:hypothetical protein
MDYNMNNNEIGNYFYQQGFQQELEKRAYIASGEGGFLGMGKGPKSHRQALRAVKRQTEHAEAMNRLSAVLNEGASARHNAQIERAGQIVDMAKGALPDTVNAIEKLKSGGGIGKGVAIGAGAVGAGLLGIHMLNKHRAAQQAQYYQQ